MSNFIFYMLAAINGAVCVSANITISSWQYWVLLGCTIGAYICGYCKGIK